MADLNVNSIGDASGGNTASINSFTPTVSNMAGRNRIINGDMRIDQRNAGASVTIVNASRTYVVDRWNIFENGSMAFSGQQSSTAPAGFSKSLLVTTTSAVTPGASDRAQLDQLIEGFNVADLGWGTANATSVTLSFFVRSSLTGQFGGVLQNTAQDYSYPFSFTINAANTFEYKTVTIIGPTAGTWGTNNTVGIRLGFDLGAGSTLLGTAGAWASADYRGATGDTKLCQTSGATFYLTGVQLEAGSVATPFEHRQYGQELALCQRYYYQQTYTAFYESIFEPCYIEDPNTMRASFYFPVNMRSAPTLSHNGVGNFRLNDGSHDETCNNITSFFVNTQRIILRFNKATANMVIATAGYINTQADNDAALYYNSEL